MIEKAKEISASLNRQMIEFCQRLVRTPSLSGDEEAISDLFIEEKKVTPSRVLFW